MPIPINNGAGGVLLTPDGVVSFRDADARQLDQDRARARNAVKPGVAHEGQLVYVSLPRLAEQARACRAQGKDLPPEIRFLGGMTQLRYVFAYPDQKDLIIAGPADTWTGGAGDHTLEPLGARTGRPLMQFDDFVVALRTAAALHANDRPSRFNHGSGGAASAGFGCSIDPAPDALTKSNDVMRQYAQRSRAERMEALRQAIGPQKVTVFNTAQDTRLAFVCIAADYRLKRITLGVENVPAVGNAIDNSRPAAGRVWFELAYDPLRVSPDGNAFEITGPRLQLKAGAQSLDPNGATAKEQSYAKLFTQKIPQLCDAVTPFADLQNIADLSLLAALIHADQLDARIGWNPQPLLDPAAFPVATIPVPRTAETLVAYTSGSLCAGGVNFLIGPVIDKSSRAIAEQGMEAPRQAGTDRLGSGAAVNYGAAPPAQQPRIAR